jgi:hypothetical protein
MAGGRFVTPPDPVYPPLDPYRRAARHLRRPVYVLPSAPGAAPRAQQRMPLQGPYLVVWPSGEVTTTGRLADTLLGPR